MTPANTTATVINCLGARMTIPRIAALSSPDASATPTPSSATSTVPSGTKLTKFETRFSTIRRSPSAFNRLTAWIIPVGLRPAVPSGRGSATLHPSHPATALIRITPIAKSTNNVTGCGSRLPSHSTKLRNRWNAPPFASGTDFTADAVDSSGTASVPGRVGFSIASPSSDRSDCRSGGPPCYCAAPSRATAQ